MEVDMVAGILEISTRWRMMMMEWDDSAGYYNNCDHSKPSVVVAVVVSTIRPLMLVCHCDNPYCYDYYSCCYSEYKNRHYSYNKQ